MKKNRVENPILEHLRAIRTDVAKLNNRMDTLAAEMTSVRQHLYGVVSLQDHDHVDLAAPKVRLDRVEDRLELADE